MNDNDYLERRPEDMFLELHDRRPAKIYSGENLWIEQQQAVERGAAPLLLQASNFGRICMATDKTNFPKLAASFTLFKNILFSDPIKHG